MAFAALGMCAANAATLKSGSFDIVIPAKAPKTVQYAAKELQTFLGQSLGGEVKVARKAAAGIAHVFLGDCAEARAAGIDVGSLKRDEFVIKVEGGGNIFIAGRDDLRRDPVKEIEKGSTLGALYERATLFGVYEFLERFAGVRFYFPGELGTVVPKRGEIAIAPCDLKVAPAMSIRRPYTGGGEKGCDGAWFDGSMPAGSGKALNWLRLRLGTDHVPCCHGLNGFKYIKRFAKSNPEYFALHTNGKRSTDPTDAHPGQLCLTSGIWEEIYQDVRSYLRGEAASVRGIPGWKEGVYGWGQNCIDRRFVDIMCQDGMMECHCPRCQAAYNREPEFGGNWATGLVWSNTVAIAKRLTAEGVPGCITQMAYSPYRKVPEIDIPSNVLVMVAVSGPWTIRKPVPLEAGLRNIREWVEKLGRPVWIWTYPGKFGAQKFPGIPQVTPKAIGEYYKKAAPMIFGTFMESESDKFLYNYLNYYMLSRICWNADTDVDATLAEHHRLMFGAAADEMAGLYSRLEDIWLEKIMGNSVDTALGPQITPPTQTKLWGEIYSPAAIAEMDGMIARALAKVPAGSLEARRVEFFGREFLGGLRAASQRHSERMAAIAALTWEPAKGSLALDNPFGSSKKRGIPPGIGTKVSLENRADAFVFTFECDEPQTAKMVAPARKHDDTEIWRDNCVEIFLNTSGDKLNYYHLLVNSAGALTDSKCVKPGVGFAKGSYEWESGAKVKVSVVEGGWKAVIEVPKASLGEIADRFPAEFLRTRNVTGEPQSYLNWSPFSHGIDELESLGTLVLR
jgi:hypothetical protein